MEKQAKKLTQEELSSLNDIKKHYSTVTQEFGAIELQQILLKERKTQAENYLAELKILEAELSKKLLDKYGPGNINIDTGEIT